MATIVNNPTPSSDDGSGIGMILGIVVGIVLVIFLIVYALPGLRTTPQPQTQTPSTIEVNLPTGGNNSQTNP